MATDIPFSVLVLGEIILVLLVILSLCVRYIFKQKSLLKRLREKYSEAKSAQASAADEKASFYGDRKAEGHHTIEEYFEKSLADSLQRYEKNTGSKLPHLDSTHSFSGRMAALRWLYLTAEKEVFDERGITHAGWGLFERKLADIIRWQDKKDTRRQAVRDNRSRLMQDQLAGLKGSNEKNKQLQEKIAQLQLSEKKLKQYQLESQRTISNLQEMLEQLRQLPTTQPAAPQEPVFGLYEIDAANKRLDESAEKNNNAINVIRELKNYKSNFSAEHKEKMDNYMNILEVELLKSDQYIGNLKKELKEAKMQVTNYAIMLRDARLEDPRLENSHMLLDTETLNQATPEISDPIEQENIIGELIQLRRNNTVQRDLINKMNDEIKLLKNSIHPTDTDAIRQEKEQEIMRLERLVKECEGCINTLESEVDHLYFQLQERSEASATAATVDGNKYDSEELTMITRELEKTISHYQQLHAINRLILELMKCDSLQSIAKLILQFIKDFKAPIGFNISSTLGKAEYFPAAFFHESIVALVKTPASSESLIHLDEGTLFIQSKIHLLHLNTQSNGHPILETSLQGLVNAAEECIKNLESRRTNQRQLQETDGWMDSTKNYLANIDIQYATQVEENRKTFNNFIAEIRRAYPLLDLHGQGAILLDNAINEYEERMHLLLSSGDVIDSEISKLIEHMEQLKTNP
jgi:hypothetical protein